MKYSIANIRYEPMEEDDAFVFFHFDVLFTEPELFTASSFYPFSRLLEYIHGKHPEFYTYINKVRNGLTSWGPAETETMEALGEEGINLLYAYLEEYLLTCNWMEGFYNQQLEWNKQSESQQIRKPLRRPKKIANHLQQPAEQAFNEQKRYRRFCELIQKEASRIAIEVYPELLDVGATKMRDFKFVFVDSVMQMHEDLSKYLDKIE